MGGAVVCKYYNPLALKDCVDGREDRIAAAPTRREDISELKTPGLLDVADMINSVVCERQESGIHCATDITAYRHIAFRRGEVEELVTRVDQVEGAVVR